MSYRVVGKDKDKNKVFYSGDKTYYKKTPQEIFNERAALYAKSEPITIVNKKNPNRSRAIPVLAVGSKGYKQAVNKFKADIDPYKEANIDLKNITATGFNQQMDYNQLRGNQEITKSQALAEKTRIDGLIERQRSEAQQKLFQNQLDVKEELAKKLNTPIQQENTVQQIPYTSSGGYAEVFQKIAGQGNQEGSKRKANVDTSSSSPLTAPITPITTPAIATETPMQKQMISAINQNVGGTNNQQNFTMPNTTGLTFGGS